MRPVPTPEQEQLRLAVREFCAGEIDVPRLRTWEESAWGVDEAFLGQVASLGWFGLGLPAPSGGSEAPMHACSCVLVSPPRVPVR